MTTVLLLFAGPLLAAVMFLLGAICYTVGKTEGYSEGWDDSERLGAKFIRRGTPNQDSERPAK